MSSFLTKEAIILAGGLGTRLASVVSDVPKPMAPVCDRPFLRYILDQLAEVRFDKVVIADGYKKEIIENYFGTVYRGMELVYSSEETPLLTGGAIKRALKFCDNEWVYVLNGDTYLDIDFPAFEESLNLYRNSANLIMGVGYSAQSDRYGLLKLEKSSHSVVSFQEKASNQCGYINVGIYLICKKALETMPEVFSFEKDWLELVVSGGKIKYSIQNGAFIDIGIPDDYKKAQYLLKSKKHKWKIAFFDRDGTINVDTGHLFEPEKLKLIKTTVEILKKYSKQSDWKIVVVTNQAGIAKGLYTVEEMRRLHKKLDELLDLEGIKIDSYYYCPHHPDFTGECECRKPKPGMLSKALFDYEADPSDCILYGDKLTDEMAAKSLGINSVLIKESK